MDPAGEVEVTGLILHGPGWGFGVEFNKVVAGLLIPFREPAHEGLCEGNQWDFESPQSIYTLVYRAAFGG